MSVVKAVLITSVTSALECIFCGTMIARKVRINFCNVSN